MAVRKRRADDGAAEGRDNVIEAPIVQRRLTVSEILRERRIECRLEVDHVAQVLMIRPAVLSDIEAGRFDQLPGAAYAIGFVRSYATYLGLDAEALVLRFKAEVAEVARRPNLSFPLPLGDTRVPTVPILIICILLAALTYGGWYYFSERHGRLADLVPAVPERLTHLLNPEQMKQEIKGAPQSDTQPAATQQAVTPQPTQPTSAPPAAATPTGQVQPTQAPTAVAPPQPAPPTPAGVTAVPPPPQAPAMTAPATAADGSAQPPAGTTQAAAADSDGVPPVEDHASPQAGQPAPAAPATPDLARPAVAVAGKATPQSSYGAPDGQARIVLHASADSWVQVRDSQGSLLITRVLKPGESYNVPNQPGLMMVTGNAGGLDMSVDGTTLPPLGISGQVVRDIKLDPERLLAAKPRAN